MEQDIATQVVGLGGASDFTLWSLFLRADFVVKFVIILLIVSSIFSWALIFDKFKLFKAINKSTEDFEKKFWKAKSAESFNNNLPTNTNDPATLIFKAAMAELLKTKRQSSAIQSARVQRILEIATDNEVKKVEKKFYFFSNNWFNSTFHWFIWNCVGYYEFFSIDCYFKKYKFSYSRSRNSRGIICNCFRFACSNTCSSCL